MEQLKNFISTFYSVYFSLLNYLGKSDLYLRLFRLPKVKSFGKLYYYLRRNTFDRTYFMGKHVLKFPTDLWTYQEIIYEKKPDVIVETGVFLGGSTYYFAKLCQMMGHGRVIAIDSCIDNADPDLDHMSNVTLIEGDTSKPQLFERIKSLIKPGEKVMVILDSDHDENHVYTEMNLFYQLVSDGQYLIVEDGNIRDVYPALFNRGPYNAIKRFLKERKEFVPDWYRNRFLLSHSPSGYLLKVNNENTQLREGYKNELDILRPLFLWLPGQPFSSDAPWCSKINQNKKQ